MGAAAMNPSEGVNPALARLQASVRIGGKGTVRRKKKVVHKTTTTDDKRLQNTKKLQDLFPGILNQVDKSVLPSLKKIAEQYNQGGAGADDDDDDDDDVPELVENFEAASK